MENNKLNIFYLALTVKECFKLPFELSFKWFSPEARLPAGVQKNELTLKCKCHAFDPKKVGRHRNTGWMSKSHYSTENRTYQCG